MPTVKGSKQERMVVVPYRPWQTFWLRAGVVLTIFLSSVGAYLYGFDRGVNESGDARAERDTLRREVTLREGEIMLLEQRILNMEQSGSVDKQALANVQQTILGLREQISQLEEDVLFYKQIMSPENAEMGLVVGQLDLIAGDALGVVGYKLELKQQGNNENLISGYANVNILGLQDEKEVSYPLRDLSEAEDDVDIRLQFRYFQNIEGSLVLPPGFEPTKVQILAVAEGVNAKTVQKSFGWLVEN